MARPNNSAAIQTRLRGLREAKAAFQAMPEEFRKALLVATGDSAKAIVARAKVRVQTSPSVRTRALLNSIAYSLNKKSGKARVGVANVTTTVTNIAMRKTVKVKGVIVSTVNKRTGNAKSVVVKPSRYAHLVEFGSSHMKAEPFIVPSADAEKMPFLERCREAGIKADKALAALYGGKTPT